MSAMTQSDERGERDERLATINAALTKRHLKPIRRLGDASKGEIEAIKIIGIFDHSEKYFTDVKFEVKLPNGNTGAFTVRFNANGEVSDGAVILALINGKFAIVKQWRLPLGQWTYEIPRGFGEKLDSAQIAGTLGTLKIADLPLGTVTRELGEEVIEGGEITSITHLGNIAENSGTSAVTPAYFLVQIEVDEDKLAKRLAAKKEEMVLKLWDGAELRSEIGRKLADNHSITAVALAMAHVERLSSVSRTLV